MQCNPSMQSPAVKSVEVGLLSGRKERQKEKRKKLKKYSRKLYTTVNGKELTIAIPLTDLVTANEDACRVVA